MGEFSNLQVGRSASIDLSNDGRGRGIADVVEPSLNGNFGVGFGEIAKAQKIVVSGGINPNGRFQFSGDARWLRGIEAGAGKVKDTAALEIVSNDLGKKRGIGFD